MRLPLTIKPYGVASNLPPASQIALESFLIAGALPFGRLWYGEPNAVNNAIGCAQHHSRSHHAVIRVYDHVDNVIETHERSGDFTEP
jgi:hypothetical protein